MQITKTPSLWLLTEFNFLRYEIYGSDGKKFNGFKSGLLALVLFQTHIIHYSRKVILVY